MFAARIACIAFIVTAAMTLVACAPLPMRALSMSHEDALTVEHREVAAPSTTGFATANATPERRRDTLDRIWRIVDNDYFDADAVRTRLPALIAKSDSELQTVRSDADFYRVLQTNVGALPDSHTGVLTPREAFMEHAQRTTLMGIGYAIVEGRVVVTIARPGFPAAEAGVVRGMLLERIDDQAIDDTFLAHAAAQHVDGEPDIADGGNDAASADLSRARQFRAVSKLLSSDSDAPASHRLTFRSADDTSLEVLLVAREGDLPTVETLRLLPSGVAVLRLSRFDPSVVSRMKDDIAAAASSRALIIDLRENPGGAMNTFVDLVDQFIDRPQVLGRWTLRFWKLQIGWTIDGDPVAHPYRKPLAVLIDGGTASAAEMTAHALVELRDAIAVGAPTCGCVVGLLREFELPDGGLLRVAELGMRSPGGRRMEADPLQPKLARTPTLAELRSGDDAVLRAAERALLELDVESTGAR